MKNFRKGKVLWKEIGKSYKVEGISCKLDFVFLNIKKFKKKKNSIKRIEVLYFKGIF